jgi:hypothetical protein
LVVGLQAAFGAGPARQTQTGRWSMIPPFDLDQFAP